MVSPTPWYEDKLRYRADQLFFAPVRVDGENIGYVSVVECIDQQEVAEKAAAEMKRKWLSKAILTRSYERIYRSQTRAIRTDPFTRYRQTRLANRATRVQTNV